MKTPKLKAQELVDIYSEYTVYWDCHNDEPDDNDYPIQCALIHIKGIQDFGRQLGIREPMMYWNMVEVELNIMLKQYEQ